MSYKCKDTCYRVECKNQGEHYAKGEKYCSTCGKFLFVACKDCPCCNSVLRISRLHKTRTKEVGF